MARQEITMPQLGETVTEGTITKWLKSVGDEVATDELLFEVSTDKVDSEVPSPEAGYLVEILVQEGETVDVGTPLAVIGDSPDGAAAEEPEAEEKPPDEEGPEPAPEGPEAREAAPEPEPEEPEAEEPEAEEAEAGPEETEAEEAAAEEPEAGEPEAEAEQEREPEPAAEDEEPPRPAVPEGAEGLVLSPVVRRLMAEYDVDPSAVEGTGAGGRITRNDVLGYIEGRPRGEAPSAAAPPGAREAPAKEAPAPRPAERPAEERAPEPAAAPAARGEGDEIVPMSNIRKRTAEHMVRSKATSPHVMMSVEADFENVERTRAAHKEEWREEEGFSLTYLPFIARAVCDALADYPHVNASVDGESLVVHQAVNLGIAVDLDFEGLLVPVVKGADGLRLRHLARSIRDLAERARNKQLGPDEIQGGTYTITNPGPFGTYISAPVINQPQVAILSTEGVKKRPVVIEGPTGDAIAVRHVGVLAQSFDHRAFDGAYCAAYLGRVREILETRDWEQELA